MSNLKQGYIQVYTGTGKGKTTAALGLCLRAAGHGFSSHVIQFMKGKINYGELHSVKKLDGLMTITQCGRPDFVSKESPDPIDVKMAGEALELAAKVISENQVDILVLDEANVAVDFKLIDEKDLLEVISNKPDKMELIVTGRGATSDIMEAADLVTEMNEIKHYWQQGVNGRKGIER